MAQRPTLFRIVSTDYTALLSVLFPVILWTMCLAMFLFDPDFTPDFVWICAAITIVSMGMLIWRLRGIYSVFEDGDFVPGTVSTILFFRDRGRITYVYDHNGEKYFSSNAILKTKRTARYQVGDQVTIIVDRNSPKRAFVKELYI